jgi:hypothetical protein
MAKYVAKTAVKRRLDINVRGLLEHTRAYQDMVMKNREMWNDPVKHYLKHK